MDIEIKGDVISASAVSTSTNFKTELGAPIMVAFDVTNKCNFRCLHCFNHSGEDIFSDELNNEGKLDVVDQIIQLKPYIVCLCGGETTCCEELIKIISRLKKVVPTVNMVSNGYLITKEVSKKLKEADINNVQISVDGINAEQHDTFRGKYGAFNKAMEAIKNLKDEGINVMVSLVPNKLNYRDAYKFFEMCSKLEVKQARSMPFLPMGRGGKGDLGSNLLLDSKEQYEFCLLMQQAKNDFTNIEIEWGDPIDHMYRMPENASLGLETYSMDVKSNGDIGVSAYFPISVGNVKRHTLKEYWDAGYKKIWQNRKIKEMVKNIENINDFNKIANLKKIDIDIIEGENYEIHNKL